ncbi:MAG TPA: outer membrane lipoprotein-sorting protein [Casimicrobiaceae bacterium]|nr:outer membrane lipoprotein-sorting protein [Casimicrobiaceae bacterium]
MGWLRTYRAMRAVSISIRTTHTRHAIFFAIGLLLTLQGGVARADDAAPARDDANARRIVEDADRIRFPGEGFQVDVAIVTTGTDKATDERKYRVLSKGNENTVVMVTEPASEHGQILLMKEHDLWVFLPNVSQPVRLSLSQRLTGEVANGDLARANFTGDYNPKLVRTETIEGEKYNVLELTAVDRSVTYPRVVYWVRESNSAPYKAEFYSLSNRLLKTCTYGKYDKVLGKLRPTELVMTDALREGEKSVLVYSAMKLRDLPDKVFTKDYLKKLE